MTSQDIRDPLQDHLLTPANAALLIVDFQATQVASIASMAHRTLVANVVKVARTAKLFGLPIVLSTVNVGTGINTPTIPQITSVLGDVEEIDRTSLNAWEDPDFKRAVQATGRKKLIFVALWTEVCLAFPTLDALHEGFEVYPVVDAVGGTSLEAHAAGLQRICQAGAKPVSWVQLVCELQRDWNRTGTSKEFAKILFGLD